MSRNYGYARVSTEDQTDALQQQHRSLQKEGCSVIRDEVISGTTPHQDRPELSRLLDFVGSGDSLVITRLDRLARSMGDLQDIVRMLEKKGASLAATEQKIDTGSASGRAFINMLATFAQFETELRRERQLEGIARAKAEGKYKGRKPIDPKRIAQVDRLASDGIPIIQACREAGIGKATYYREKQKQNREGDNNG